jgi:hypothetical protein
MTLGAVAVIAVHHIEHTRVCDCAAARYHCGVRAESTSTPVMLALAANLDRSAVADSSSTGHTVNHCKGEDSCQLESPRESAGRARSGLIRGYRASCAAAR